MPRFKPLNYQQNAMVVINYLDQLQAGTYEHAIHHLKNLKRFSLRGKDKVQGQWQLFCLIHNIEKLKNYGELVA